jgi:homogentisate 1,2-dioxygenase
MSRNDIEIGQITLTSFWNSLMVLIQEHMKEVLGKNQTEELAVMVDTFKPLKLTVQALELEIKDYYKSWMH